ncbi:MAG: N-acetyltransferase, partial [Firmicutes bacterium]|nr:N-acetyltransferase [Bacillota bacterium]
LLSRMKKILDPRHNGYLRRGPFRLFLAYRDGKPVGRIMVGVDEETNRAKGLRDGWFALFESIPEYEVAEGLLRAGEEYLLGLGGDRMRGPVSPSGGDDYRGLLVWGFDSPPVLMDSYNPPYYQDFFARYGLEKFIDWLAYRLSPREPKNPRAVAYAQERYGFRLDPVDFSRLDREIRDIHTIISRAMPAWPDQTPPSLAQVRAIARDLKAHADPDLAYIARAGDEPIGFGLSMPDLNQVLIHLNGRLFPFGWLKYLYWRRKIDGLRFFVLFVVPEWQKKGVSAAIYLKTFEAARRKGMRWGEGSTIREENLPMRRDVERAGGVHYKTYRVYVHALR